MKKHTSAAVVKNSGGSDRSGMMKAWSLGRKQVLVRRLMQVTIFLAAFLVCSMFLCNSASSIEFHTFSHYFTPHHSTKAESKLESVLRNASMEYKTVIITTLNDEWAKPGSIFELFLDSFRLGNETQRLLNHLVVITWDQKTLSYCLALHNHCYQVETKGANFTGEVYYMSPTYLHMMWRRTEFLTSVLEMGYNFLFTDTDIMWLRDPFKQFYEDADFQIACDAFSGNSTDMHNLPNGGLKYMKSNNRTIWFNKFWYNSSKEYPGLGEQGVFNKIKKHPLISEMKLRIRFISTSYFGGFCEPSKDFNKVSTMHANCCVGIDNKVNDLKLLLQDWNNYMALSEYDKKHSNLTWRVPQSCSTSIERGIKERRKKQLAIERT